MMIEYEESGIGEYLRVLTDAEKACFDILCDVLELKAGVNAFRGVGDGRHTDFAIFDIGQLQNTGETTAFVSNAWHFRARLEFYTRFSRESLLGLQATAMKLLCKLPLYADGQRGNSHPLMEGSPVHCLRIAPDAGAIGEAQVARITINGEEVPVWNMALALDVVFALQPQATATAQEEP